MKSIFFSVLFILLLLSAVQSAPILQNQETTTQDYVSLEVKDVAIQDVLTMISKYTGVNLLCHKSVRGLTTVKLKDIYYEKAVELICKINNLSYRKIGNTLLIAPPKELEDAFDAGLTKVFRLQFANANETAGILKSIFKGPATMVFVAVDERNNSVIVSGTQAMMDQVDKMIKNIDVPVFTVDVELQLKVRKKEETLLFRTSARSDSGKTIFIKSGDKQIHSKETVPAVSTENGYRFKLKCNVNDDGFIRLEADGEMSLSENTTDGPVIIYKEISTVLPVRNGEESILCSFYEKSLDSTFTLTAKLQVIKENK